MIRSRIVVVVILTAASFTGCWLGRTAHESNRRSARVVDVVDGDTIHVIDGGHRETVRLLGVDTPETHDPRKPVQCYGPEAAAYTARRLTGREVELEDDVETHDKYGRRLSYVYLDGERYEDDLLEHGYARLLVIPPNGVYGRTMLSEELAAKRARMGLWGACGDE
jgi:micrococcal nuclease